MGNFLAAQFFPLRVLLIANGLHATHKVCDLVQTLLAVLIDSKGALPGSFVSNSCRCHRFDLRSLESLDRENLTLFFVRKWRLFKLQVVIFLHLVHLKGIKSRREPSVVGQWE